MTTINKDQMNNDLISVENPQGALPEIRADADQCIEQMEFSLESGIDNKKVFYPTMQSEPAVYNSPVVNETTLNEQSSSIEFQLEKENVEIDTPQAPLTLSEPISLPAALCDDLLLEEINSIPDKMGFKIGDVADLLGIKQYVLRYWESEFDLLKPKKALNNQRLYTKKDVENAFLIRKLLHRDRFSIEGARSALKGLKAFVKKESQKEKEIKQAYTKIDSFQERLENLAIDVRRIRQLFR